MRSRLLLSPHQRYLPWVVLTVLSSLVGAVAPAFGQDSMSGAHSGASDRGHSEPETRRDRTDAKPVTDRPYYEFQVDKPAALVSGSPTPRYPESLRSTGTKGAVLAQFVIDTTGRVDMSSFKVVKSENDAFAKAVKETLPNMRFHPAEIDGRKVSALVQRSFAFVEGK